MARFSGLARVSVVVGLLLLLSRVLGLVRELIVADQFGASGETDAFYLVFAFIIVPASSALVAVPRVLVAPIHQRESAVREGAGHALAWTALVVMVVAGCGAALALSVYAEPLVVAYTPGFAPADQLLTARLLRLSSLLIPLGAASGTIAALSQSRGHFYLVQGSFLWCNLMLVLGLLIGGPRLGVEAAVWGALAGAGLQLLTLLVYPIREGLMPRVESKEWGPAMTLMGSVLILYGLSHTGGHLYLFVDRFFAALLPEGQLSCLGYAQRLMTLPVQVIWAPLSIVLLPAFSAAASAQNRAELEYRLGRTLRLLLLALLFPLSLLAVFGVPIVDVVYGRGKFDEADVVLTGLLLGCQLPSVLAKTVLGLVSVVFLAHGNVRMPVAFGVVRTVAIAATYPFVWEEYGAVGLVLVLSLVDTLVMVLVLILGRRLLALTFPGILGFLVRNFGATAVGVALAAGLWYLLQTLGWMESDWMRLSGLMASSGLGFGAWWGAMLLLGVEEARELPALALSAFGKLRDR